MKLTWKRASLKFQEAISILLVVLIAGAYIPQAFAAERINLTPETTEILLKNDGVPFYANFAHSDDGRVSAQVFFDENSQEIVLTFSNNFGLSWSSKKLDKLNFSQPHPEILVSGDGSTISVFWESGDWNGNATFTFNKSIKNIVSVDSGKTWSNVQNITSRNSVEKMAILWSSIDDSDQNQIIAFLTNAVTCGSCDPSELFIATSSNQGIDWRIKRSNAQNLQQLYGDAIVSNDGTQMAYIYESYGNPISRGRFKMAISTDSGATWSEEWIAIQNPTGSSGLRFIHLDSKRIVLIDTDSNIQISIDRGKNFAKRSKIFGFLPNFIVSNDGMDILAVTAEVSPAGRNVNFAKSMDGGVSWSINTTLTSRGRNSNVVSASPDLKTVGVVWSDWDSRATYFQLSSNYGKTWSSPIEIVSKEQARLGAVGYRMDALIFDSSKKRFFFAYQDLVLDPVRTSSLRGVEIPLFSISINDNNGDSQSYLTLGQSKISKELFPSSPLKKHFKFLGWSYVDGGQAVSLDEIKVEGDLSFYASWRELPKFTIEYFSNGVLEKTSEPITIWADDSFTVESSVTLKKNFKFLEWNSKPDGSGIKYLPGKAITALDSNLKLYAIGKPNVTISCVKGKTIKKLTGPNPKCPAGYMKK